MTKKERFRLRFTFWLDMLDHEEQALAEKIETLKTQRTFAKTIRDGIRLICDLRAGKLDVLFELFPWVKAEFLAGVQPQKTAGEVELQHQLERLEKLLTAQQTVRSDTPKALQSVSVDGPPSLNVPKFDLPRFDDDDEAETLVLTKDTSTDSALNFLNSMMRLQQ